MARTELKTIGLLVAAVMTFSLTLGTAAACAGKNDPETYTVTFYDGTTVITEKEVEDGEKIAAFMPADTPIIQSRAKFFARLFYFCLICLHMQTTKVWITIEGWEK